MRQVVVVLALAFSLVVADGVLADEIEVTYFLIPSTSGIPPVQPDTSHFDVVRLSPEGPVSLMILAPIAGSAVITFSGDGPRNIVDGPVTIGYLVFTMAFQPGFAGDALGLNGFESVTLAAPVHSTAAGGSIASATGTLHVTGTVTCDGACIFLGIPASTTLDTTVTADVGGTYTTGDPNPFGLSTVSLTLPLAILPGDLPLLSGNAALFGIGGGELIPEPSTLLLLGAGITGLGCVGRRHRAKVMR